MKVSSLRVNLPRSNLITAETKIGKPWKVLFPVAVDLLEVFD